MDRYSSFERHSQEDSLNTSPAENAAETGASQEAMRASDEVSQKKVEEYLLKEHERETIGLDEIANLDLEGIADALQGTHHIEVSPGKVMQVEQFRPQLIDLIINLEGSESAERALEVGKPSFDMWPNELASIVEGAICREYQSKAEGSAEAGAEGQWLEEYGAAQRDKVAAAINMRALLEAGGRGRYRSSEGDFVLSQAPDGTIEKMPYEEFRDVLHSLDGATRGEYVREQASRLPAIFRQRAMELYGEAPEGQYEKENSVSAGTESPETMASAPVPGSRPLAETIGLGVEGGNRAENFSEQYDNAGSLQELVTILREEITGKAGLYAGPEVSATRDFADDIERWIRTGRLEPSPRFGVNENAIRAFSRLRGTR